MARILGLLSTCLLLGVGSPANAVPIVSITPSSSVVTVSDTVALDVVVGGLNNEFVGAYDLSLAWNSSLLSLTGVAFDTFLDGPDDSIRGYDIGLDSLSIFEISLGLLANQTGLDSFRLFSLSFSTLAAGVASVNFTPDGIQLLSDELGTSFMDFGRNGAQISIASPGPGPVQSVPEPSSLALLLAAGLVALLQPRRSKRAGSELRI